AALSRHHDRLRIRSDWERRHVADFPDQTAHGHDRDGIVLLPKAAVAVGPGGLAGTLAERDLSRCAEGNAIALFHVHACVGPCLIRPDADFAWLQWRGGRDA